MRKKLFWVYIYRNYPSNKIFKIRKELDKKMTNVILFSVEPRYLNRFTQIPHFPEHFSVPLDFDLLYLQKYHLMTQTPLKHTSTELFWRCSTGRGVCFPPHPYLLVLTVRRLKFFTELLWNKTNIFLPKNGIKSIMTWLWRHLCSILYQNLHKQSILK